MPYRVAPYLGSNLIEQLKRDRHLNFVDLDGTLTGPVEFRRKALKLMRERGPIIYATARAAEMVMSSASLRVSQERYDFRRPRPHLVKRNGRYTYQPIETLPEYECFYDPDAIIGFGTGIYVRQADGGYMTDRRYAELMGIGWRKRYMEYLKKIDHDGLLIGSLAAIESKSNYVNGLTDVAPLPYRIQHEFSGPDGLRQKTEAKLRIMLGGMPGFETPIADLSRAHTSHNIRPVDESKPGMTEYKFYSVPKHATKERAVQHLVQTVVRAAGLSLSDISFFYAGDTLTDLKSSYALPGVRMSAFLLASGSPVAPYLSEGNTERFADESLNWIRGHRRKPMEGFPSGYYSYSVPRSQFRMSVIGDEAFPDATSGAESICRFWEGFEPFSRQQPDPELTTVLKVARG